MDQATRLRLPPPRRSAAAGARDSGACRADGTGLRPGCTPQNRTRSSRSIQDRPNERMEEKSQRSSPWETTARSRRRRSQCCRSGTATTCGPRGPGREHEQQDPGNGASRARAMPRRAAEARRGSQPRLSAAIHVGPQSYVARTKNGDGGEGAVRGEERWRRLCGPWRGGCVGEWQPPRLAEKNR